MSKAEPDRDAEMKLPEGKTCADCIHAYRCSIFGFSQPTETSCDFWPSLFRLRAVAAAPPPDGQDVGWRRGDCFGPAGCDDCADCRIASGPCDEVHDAPDGQDVGKVGP